MNTSKFKRPLGLILLTLCVGYGPSILAKNYEAGSTTIFIHDPSRTFVPYGTNPINTPGSIRTNIAEMWYPVNPDSIDENSVKARYIDYYRGDQLTCEAFAFNWSPRVGGTALPGVTALQLSTANKLLCSTSAPEGIRNSYLNAPIAKGTFPVVVMATSSAGSRAPLAGYAEKWAQNGYIVIVTENSGDSTFAQPAKDPHFCDIGFNRVLCVSDGFGGFKPDPAIFTVTSTLSNPAAPPNTINVVNSSGGLLTRRSGLAGPTLAAMKIADVPSIIAAIHSMNAGNPCSVLSTTCDPTLPSDFAGHFDLSNMALGSHSAGGEVVQRTLNTDPNFKIGFVMMPNNMNSPVLRPVIQKPIMYIVSEMDDTTGSCFLPSMGLATFPTPTNRHPDTLNNYNAATNAALYITLLKNNHLHALNDQFVYFPDLTSTTAFDPLGPVVPYCQNTLTIPYTLVPSAIVHKIVEDRTTAFLDLYLKQHKGNANGIIKQDFKALTEPDDTGFMTIQYRNLDLGNFLNNN